MTSSDDKSPKTATEAARRASEDVDHALWEAEMSGRTPRGYDVRLMRERERRTKSEHSETPDKK